MKTSNITPLRKALRNASEIYGQVKLADGTTQRMRLIKGDAIDAFRKTHAEKWPERVEFRTDAEGNVFLGESPSPKSIIQDLTAQVASQLAVHGIDLEGLDPEEAVAIFREAISAPKERGDL